MGLESGTFIDDFVVTNPLGTDDRSTADDHIRLIKTFIKNTFPNIDAAVNPTPTELNLLVGLLATATELNKLDGATMTTTELNFLVGILGAIIDTQGGQTILGSLALDGELILNAGYSEDDASYTVGSGNKSLDLSAATYFFPTGAMTAVSVDFTFANPAASGRVTSFTLELNNMTANTDSTPWPTSVDWPAGLEPVWTSGIDIVAFWTRNGGSLWHGSAVTLDSK